ncbi:MAG TPA: CbiX/SirB N-terminal domain-containing protein [Candidatus Rifleibacterium sp.]|nr:CbiX/SirB N-terminal domain-containing protein [Candidatus Rifleibacterium sp.]HPT44923.1 CbiX/SirB N-terminal domain-containing protein [Candidatus Rifleibacterium sp.]
MQNETFSILIFHGSARSETHSTAMEFARVLSEETGCKNFTVCFLKGLMPDLEEALNAAIEQGWHSLRLLPLFLLPGTHTSHDIPTLAAQCQARNPEVKISIDTCLVKNPGFLRLIAAQIKETAL